jgi:hypothetical protein
MGALQPMHLIVLLVPLLPLLLGFVVWIAALVDAIGAPDDAYFRAGTKLIWVLVIVFTGWIGGLIYWVVGRPRVAS